MKTKIYKTFLYKKQRLELTEDEYKTILLEIKDL